MERLTKRTNNKLAILKGSSCNYSAHSFDCQINEGREKLKAALDMLTTYEDLEEQGLLVRLPCKPGDDVYVISLRGGRHIVPAVVLNISFLVFSSHSKNATDMVINVTTKSNKKIIYHLEDIGKVMFLTREEAEKKLEEMKNES